MDPPGRRYQNYFPEKQSFKPRSNCEAPHE